MNKTPIKVTQKTDMRLYITIGSIDHLIYEVLQGKDFISIVYYVKDTIDAETNKPVKRTIINDLEKL